MTLDLFKMSVRAHSVVLRCYDRGRWGFVFRQKDSSNLFHCRTKERHNAAPSPRATSLPLPLKRRETKELNAFQIMYVSLVSCHYADSLSFEAQAELRRLCVLIGRFGFSS